MKKLECIESNRDTIIKEMTELYRDILENGGGFRYDLYIWSDGEIEALRQDQHGRGYLKAKESEKRELFFVASVKYDDLSFDPWDCYPEERPEDEEEAEEIEKEIIDDCVNDYDAEEVLNQAIEEAEENEDE